MLNIQGNSNVQNVKVIDKKKQLIGCEGRDPLSCKMSGNAVSSCARSFLFSSDTLVLLCAHFLTFY